MLKFRFRKKEMRRRSNSCPNLDSCTAAFDSGVGKEKGSKDLDIGKHASCSVGGMSDQGSDNEAHSPTRKERQQAQKSIRRVKKKEKEQQENMEKNLLSVDDFWRKLDSLKEWLHDEGSKEVDHLPSPKLRSHFKKFIKLWNKRKLPIKYYKNCCVDGEVESSSAEVPVGEQTGHQSPTNRLRGHDPSTFDFLSQKKLKDMPSYHRFPFVDEPSDHEMLSQGSSPSAFSTQSTISFIRDASTRTDDSCMDSPFSTFGKSMNDPHTSTSLLAQQIDVCMPQRKNSKSKNAPGPLSPLSLSSSSSPKKFATICRSTPASSVFKSSSQPQIHPVVSPTCPHPPPMLTFPPPPACTHPAGLDTDRTTRNPSPAYMSVQDAIPFANGSSPSPQYWQVGFDDVFEDSGQSHYCSLSPFLKKPSNQNKSSDSASSLSKQSLRRRSKSMEDIYAIPARLLTYDVRKKITSPFLEDAKSSNPPVPVKMFTPTTSEASLSGGKTVLAGGGQDESSDSLGTSLPTTDFSHSRLAVSLSGFSSVNSLSTDTGYQSGRLEESSNSHQIADPTSTSNMTFLSSFKSHQSFAGTKRRSEEHDGNMSEMDWPKRSRSTSQHPITDCVDNPEVVGVDGRDNVAPIDGEFPVDMDIADFLKDSQGACKSSCSVSSGSGISAVVQAPKKSILTGSLHPTTRTPKMDDKGHQSPNSKRGKDRLSILQIKVLDKSPEFPRRRVKRRSSSLVITPGKGLTFGNKPNIRLAASAPRRVSFARNVKDASLENTTPSRGKSSSASKACGRRGTLATKSDNISRQSHDKAEFESFWARYENQCNTSSTSNNNDNKKPGSPVKEGGNSPKKWSPLKWLSPSKETTISSASSPTQPQQPICDDGDEKGRSINKTLTLSLSPKKLFHSFQNKNSSPSSMTTVPGSTVSPPPCNVGMPGNRQLMGSTVTAAAKPKSILKIGSRVETVPFTSTFSNSYRSQSPFSPPKQNKEKTFSPPKPNDFHATNLSHSSNRPSVSELNFNLCRSPPRLGVASLRAARLAATASHSISSLPRSKQRILLATEEVGQNQMNTPCFATSPTHQSSLAADIKPLKASPTQNKDDCGVLPGTNRYRETQGRCDTGIQGHCDMGVAHADQSAVLQEYQHNYTGVRSNPSPPSLSCPNGEGNVRAFNPNSNPEDAGLVLPQSLCDSDKEEGIKVDTKIKNIESLANDGGCTEFTEDRLNGSRCRGDISNTLSNGEATQAGNKTSCEVTRHLSDLHCEQDMSASSPTQAKITSSPDTDNVLTSGFNLIPSAQSGIGSQAVDTFNKGQLMDTNTIVDNNKHPCSILTSSTSDANVCIHWDKEKPNTNITQHEKDIVNQLDWPPPPYFPPHSSSQPTVLSSCEGGNHQQQGLSKNVLERIKSFRASPKVEDNDGWITERRRASKGGKSSKSKSFRDSPNQSLVQSLSPPQLQEVMTRGQGTFGYNAFDLDMDMTGSSDTTLMAEPKNNKEGQLSLIPGKFLCDASDSLGLCVGNNNESNYHGLIDDCDNALSILDDEYNVKQPCIMEGDGTESNGTVAVGRDADKGYETESRSGHDEMGGSCNGTTRGSKDKRQGVGQQGGYEEESLSSLTSCDSGSCVSYNTSASTLTSQTFPPSTPTSCPVYDVPRPGNHPATPKSVSISTLHHSNPTTAHQLDGNVPSLTTVHHSASVTGTASLQLTTTSTSVPTITTTRNEQVNQSVNSHDHHNVPQCNAIPCADNSHNVSLPTGSGLPVTQFTQASTHSYQNQDDKENSTIHVKPLLKPKPPVKPKPKLSTPKPGNATSRHLHQSATSSLSLSPKVKMATSCLRQPPIKRRSSVVKRESSVSIPHSLRQQTSSSLPLSSSFSCRINKNGCQGNNQQMVRPIVRKRSSITPKREESLRGIMSGSSSPKATRGVTSPLPPRSLQLPSNDSQRECSTAISDSNNVVDGNLKRRKRTSLEKAGAGTGRRSSSSRLSSRPEQTSFALRRKFFQQLQLATPSTTRQALPPTQPPPVVPPPHPHLACVKHNPNTTSSLVRSPSKPANGLVKSPSKPANSLVRSLSKPANSLVRYPSKPANSLVKSPSKSGDCLTRSPLMPAASKQSIV